MQLPPRYCLKLAVPDPVVGSKVIAVETAVIGIITGPNGEDVGPTTTALAVKVPTEQAFPAMSRVARAIPVSLNDICCGRGAEAQFSRAVNPALKQTVSIPLPVDVNLPARLASVTRLVPGWARRYGRGLLNQQRRLSRIR